MTPVWLAFASGVVLGSFVTLVCVAVFMMYVAKRQERHDNTVGALLDKIEARSGRKVGD